MPWAGAGGEIMTLSVLLSFLWFSVFSFSSSLFSSFLSRIPSAFVGEVVVGLCEKVWVLFSFHEECSHLLWPYGGT